MRETPTGPTAARPVGVRVPRFDLEARPHLVLMELTRACDLACRHCRAESVTDRSPDELTTGELEAVFDDLGSLGSPRPIVVLSGGDPLKRPDLAHLVAHATAAGARVAISPAGTPLVTRKRLAVLRSAGAGAASFSIDGASAKTHDAFRQVDGSLAWTLAACRAAKDVGLRLQVNTTVSAATVHELPEVLRLVAELGANTWSVFFLVPVGRGGALAALSAEETEDVVAFLHDASAIVPLKTTEAPQYRRLVLSRQPGADDGEDRGVLYRELRARLEELRPLFATPRPEHGRRSVETGGPKRSPFAVGDGRGVVFVSRSGEIYPSGFLPLSAGNVRETPLTECYASSPLFRSLRDPARLGGRCGRCAFAGVCGGSRAQAFARTGDPLAEDPTCPYVPSGVEAEPEAV